MIGDGARYDDKESSSLFVIEIPVDVIYMVSHICFVYKVYNSNLVFWSENQKKYA